MVDGCAHDRRDVRIGAARRVDELHAEALVPDGEMIALPHRAEQRAGSLEEQLRAQEGLVRVDQGTVRDEQVADADLALELRATDHLVDPPHRDLPGHDDAAPDPRAPLEVIEVGQHHRVGLVHAAPFAFELGEAQGVVLSALLGEGVHRQEQDQGDGERGVHGGA